MGEEENKNMDSSAGSLIYCAVYRRGDSSEPLSSSYICEVESSTLANVCSELIAQTKVGKPIICLQDPQNSYNFLLSTTESGLQVIVVSDKGLGLGIPCLYIREITNKFTGSYGNFGKEEDMTTPLAGRGYREFDAVIKNYGEQLVRENPQAKTNALVDHVKDIMIENMDKALSRHTKIEVILKDAESLKQVSMKFHHEAKEAKMRMCWKNYRCWVFISLGLL